MTETTIDINPYCMTLTIVQTDDFRRFGKKYAPEEDIEKVIGRVGFIHNDEERLFVVFCENVSSADIVHECVHLTNEVFKWIHAKLDVDNDEPQAYLTAWFFKVIECFLKLNLNG